MKIGIIGTGHIGSTLARHFSAVGHEVAVANSHGPDTLRDLESDLGRHGHAMTAAEAEQFGDVVFVSVPFKSYADIPDNLAGKVVIDTTNYYPSRDGHFTELDSDIQSSSEVLAGQLDGARIVKAFNAIEWTSLRDKAGDMVKGQYIGIPMSGDDPAAKQVVAGLISQIGFEAVDAGSLAEGGRKHQPGSDVYLADLSATDLRSKVTA
ncbi:MAG TPA: NAD(P)-binding domain-containing protein [Trebonia sp.]|nr:NAD(P)-binding domain-containing protein [Trebonia sp.]